METIVGCIIVGIAIFFIVGVALAIKDILREVQDYQDKNSDNLSSVISYMKRRRDDRGWYSHNRRKEEYSQDKLIIWGILGDNLFSHVATAGPGWLCTIHINRSSDLELQICDGNIKMEFKTDNKNFMLNSSRWQYNKYYRPGTHNHPVYTFDYYVSLADPDCAENVLKAIEEIG